MTTIAATEEETQSAGRQLATLCDDALNLILLEGELGAGKTTFMKGVAVGWQVAAAEQVTSPTYTLIHEYHASGRSLYHLDLYRIETQAQLETLGLEDLIAPPPPPERRLIAIEWAERIAAQLTSLPRWRVRLVPAAGGARTITTTRL
ncbi:MAG TPA: tRNA (adenosine(37)-N6)-threonylcarbamoyltransferase complex ATPase subunit type 1 TsaE [Terriglobales bacterium]